MKNFITCLSILLTLLVSLNSIAQDSWLCYTETQLFYSHTPNLSILENQFDTKLNTHYASFKNSQALYGADISFSPLKHISLKFGISSTNYQDENIKINENQYLVENKTWYLGLGYYNQLEFQLSKKKEKKHHLHYNIFAGIKKGDYTKRFICIDQISSLIHNPTSYIELQNNYFIAASIKYAFFKYQFKINMLDINSISQSFNEGALFNQSINFISLNDPLILQNHHFRLELEGKLANIFVGYGFIASLKEEIKGDNSFLLYENVLFKDNFNLGITLNAHNFKKENIPTFKMPLIKLPVLKKKEAKKSEPI